MLNTKPKQKAATIPQCPPKYKNAEKQAPKGWVYQILSHPLYALESRHDYTKP